MQHWKKLLDLGLVLLVSFSLAIMFLANEDAFVRERLCSIVCFRSQHAAAFNKIFYDIAATSLVTVLFYFLVVRLPEYLTRQRIKRLIVKQYRAFKIDCIQIFLLVADASYPAGLPEQLLLQQQWRKP